VLQLNFFDNYVGNMAGVADSPAGALNAGAGFDPLMYRPYVLPDGRRCCSVKTGRMLVNADGDAVPEIKAYTIKALQERNIYHPTWNAQLLPLRAWIAMDEAIVRQRRLRLRAYEDLAARARRTGFNAYAKSTIEYQAMTDPGEAVRDMDGTMPGRTDRPLFKTFSSPLPITHCDFFFTDRELEIARAGRMPLDGTMFEAAARRIWEAAEQGLIGTATGITYGTRSTGPDAITGTSTEYGYTTFPYRITKTDLHTPTSANPENVVEDVLEMRETLRSYGYFGPYMVYHSTGYDRFLDDDYFRTGGTAVTRTLRERIESIEGIEGFRRLDYLSSGYQLIMLQIDREVAEAIVGMEPTTMMWTGRGGAIHYYMIMAILTQIMKVPYAGIAGVVHGTTS
jgi:hypothetical protein